MKRGFTLIELLVVIGIMGMMATVSIGGYAALTRGMSESGALKAARGAADVALQRAQIDRTRTYLYLFDEVTRLDTEEDVGIVCGVAIAVRSVGRISRVSDASHFYDEFGDFTLPPGSETENESASEQEAGAGTFRLYNLTQQDFATVKEGVFLDGTSQAADLEDGDKGVFIKAYGFEKVSGVGFEVGDEYGQEFLVVRLPPGYTFSSSVQMTSSSDLGLKKAGSPILFDATGDNDPSPRGITVYSRRPDGSFQSIGITTQLKDLNGTQQK